MITRKLFIAKAFVLALASFPQFSDAQTFTGETVLTWSEESQNSLFQTSIVMANIVATQTGSHDHMVECINEWYGTEALQAQRHDHIRSVIEDYPEHHPQAIILAVIERACGQFEGD